MEEKIKQVYKVLQGRYVKVAWTHKIHEKQAELHLKKNDQISNCTAVVNTLSTSVALLTFLEKLMGFIECNWFMPLLTAVISVISLFLLFRYKDGIFEERAKSNKQYAAKCHNLRNKYEDLLCDIKLGNLTDLNTIIQRRNELSEQENLLYLGIDIPHTTNEAVDLAVVALKKNKDSKTEDDEIRSIVPEYLQEF